ncbi:MAG: CAP domain-containing protein, partial [Methanomicrobiales archaeon HGW-Methanomicrobiales-5]
NRIESTVGNSAPVIDISTLESRIHEGINQQRKNNGLSSLSYDSSLASIAREHSADMARNNYFAHVNLQGLDPSGRGNQAGYSCYKNYGSYYTTGIAENIMQNNLYDSITTYNGIPRYAWNSQEEIAQSTVSGWMNSPGHRKNILTSTYDREGIGVAIAADDKVYITQDFC